MPRGAFRKPEAKPPPAQSSQVTIDRLLTMLKLIALLTALLALTGPALVAGHGAVIWPPPRNAIDKDVAPWNRAPPSQDDDRGGDGSGDGGGEDVNGANFCIHPDRHGRPSNSNGQACFW